MDDAADFIEQNDLTYTETPELVQWGGRIHCQRGFELTITKYQDRRVRFGGSVQVRTIRYSYHATRRVGDDVVNVLRYDNIHAHEGHADAHHLHVFDDTGTEVEVRHIGYDDWPVLSDVIAELRTTAFR